MTEPASKGRLERIGRIFEALVARDLEALMSGTAEEVEWRNPKGAVEPGVRTGRDAFAEALGRLLEMFEYERFEILDSAERGEAVALRVRQVGRGRGSGVPIDVVLGQVMWFEGERVVAFEWFDEPDQALAAVGAEHWPGDAGNGS